MDSRRLKIVAACLKLNRLQEGNDKILFDVTKSNILEMIADEAAWYKVRVLKTPSRTRGLILELETFAGKDGTAQTLVTNLWHAVNSTRRK